MSSIYIPSNNSGGGVTKTYVDESIQPLAAQVNTATSSNTASTLVKRDVAGDFVTNKIKVSSVESTGSTLGIASDDTTSTLNIGSGTGVQTINVGNNGTGATTINLGGAGDTVNISGTLNNVTTTNTQVADKSLVLNSGGAASTAGQAGIYIEEAGDSSNSYMRVNLDRTKMELKAPNGPLITLSQSLQTTDIPLFRQVMVYSNDITKVASTGAAVFAWNRLDGSGRTLFANQQGGGYGGWEWLNYNYLNIPTPSANPQMTLDREGNLAVSGSLRLATTGGTAGNLNHYEEYNVSTMFTGAVSQTVSIPISIVRVGKQVTLRAKAGPQVTAAFTSGLSNMTTIPARFMPDTDVYLPILTIENSNMTTGVLYVPQGAGTLFIAGAGNGNFIAGQACGFHPFSVSWTIA